MSGAGLKLLVILPVLLVFGGVIFAAARRARKEKERNE